MSKMILIALVGLCVVLTVCGCTTADNANEREYCIEFNFKEGSLRCPYWDTMHAEDGIRGYKICFKSNYTVQDRSDGLSGPMIGCDGKSINGGVDFQFVSASARFQLDTDYLEELVRLPNDAKNVTKGSLSVQNLNYTYATYYTDVDKLGNIYKEGKQNGVFNTTIEGPLSLIVTTDHMSLEENIELFESIRIVPITHTLYSSRGNYSLEPYNITFNFGGMDEYEVVDSKGLNRIESDMSPREQMVFGWAGSAVLELDRDSQSNIKLSIGKCLGVPDCVGAWKNFAETHYAQSRFDDSTVIKDMQINGVTWHSYRGISDIERPIPINKIKFEADLNSNESAVVLFTNVPDSVIEEFMNSLNITGLGNKNIQETWDQYVTRTRVSSPIMPGISALEFIDMYFEMGIRYENTTGDLYELWNTGTSEQQMVKLSKEKVESMAIRSGYYGPIPLPKNVSVTSPNGAVIA